MRAFTRVLAICVFALSLASTLATHWVVTNIADEDGFVDTSTAIGANPDVRKQVINVASVQIASKANLGPSTTARIAEATSEVLTQAIDAEGFDEAWANSMRSTHRRYLGSDAPSNVEIDIAPFVDLAIDQSVILKALGVSAPDQLFVQALDTDLRGYISHLSQSQRYRTISLIATIASALIALATTKRRRHGSTLALLGTATIAVTLLSALGVRLGAARMVEAILDQNRDVAPVVRPIGDMLTNSYDTMLIPVAVVGIALAAIGVIWRAISRFQK